MSQQSTAMSRTSSASSSNSSSSSSSQHYASQQGQYQQWTLAATIDIDDEDITFDGKPLSALFEESAARKSQGSKKTYRGRKMRRE